MYINVMRLLLNKLCGQPMVKDLFEYDSEEKVNNCHMWHFYNVIFSYVWEYPGLPMQIHSLAGTAVCCG